MEKIFAQISPFENFLFYNFYMKKFLGLVLFMLFIPSVSAHEEEGLVLDAKISKDAISSNVAVYNISNGKMHTHDCEWAQKCTKNCIYLHKHEIQDMFYIPCAACGGGVIEPVENSEEE